MGIIHGLEECFVRGDSFCPLGVLCDIYRKETKKADWWVVSYLELGIIFHELIDESQTLPEEVQKWAGLTSKNPTIDCVSIGYMNDHMSLSFLDLAQKILVGL